MEDRINKSKELLSEEANFYLHLDHNANYFGRLLLSNIFSKDNFIREIIWNKQNVSGGKAGADNWILSHDSILYYSQDKIKRIFNKQYLPYSEEYIEERFTESDSNGRYRLQGNGRKQYLQDSKGVSVSTIWNIKDVNVMAIERMFFRTQKPEKLLHRIIKSSSNENSNVLDYYSGSATTIAVSHKLKRKWMGLEMGEHFENINIPRMKKVLLGDKGGISELEDVNWQGGGFFKYYELEQYEEVLSRAKYQWQGKKGENQVEQYSFLQDQKLLDAIEIDYEKKNAKVVFEKLYPDVDIAETLSNLSGKHIKQLFEDKVVFEDGSEVIYDEMTFEKYPWIKPLIWWNSK